ncbi:MAG: helix-turn-helix transcriptional regulator [Bacteriovoracaceae bacterium]|nr:helix-turn-helix transcriptional regulator [Bacteriovoracaceae bacterium]
MRRKIGAIRPELWLSKEVIIYKGPIPVNRLHLHRALQIIISPYGPIHVDDGSSSMSVVSNVVIIPPFARHYVRGKLEPCLVLFYEPNTIISKRFPNTTFVSKSLPLKDMKRCKEYVENFEESSKDVASLGHLLLDIRIEDFKRPTCKDSRIENIIRIMESLDESMIKLVDIATEMKISESRLVHLFSDEMKMPFKSYYKWLKIRKALALIKEGKDLTTAAHESGFTDSSHFSRTFKSTFGFNPSFLKLIYMFS